MGDAFQGISYHISAVVGNILFLFLFFWRSEGHFFSPVSGGKYGPRLKYRPRYKALISTLVMRTCIRFSRIWIQPIISMRIRLLSITLSELQYCTVQCSTPE
jgi:hypothetical protein